MKQSKANHSTVTVALAGNPNVGKSTLFNSLTGMHRHTGNWSGKTVDLASGEITHNGVCIKMVDLPGCYSLLSHSEEELIARDYICSADANVTLVVCDATCLQKNLNLVLQCIEISRSTVVCINMMDEAKKRGISINLKKLSEELGVAVFGTCARRGRGVSDMISYIADGNMQRGKLPTYSEEIEHAVLYLGSRISKLMPQLKNTRFAAIKMLCSEWDAVRVLAPSLDCEDMRAYAEEALCNFSLDSDSVRQETVSLLLYRAKEITESVSAVITERSSLDSRLDRIFCGRVSGFAVMTLLIALVFWITLVLANRVSGALGSFLFAVEDKLDYLLNLAGAPNLLIDALVHGMYRTLAWVVSVMLPPMAIFFPLFAILEDFGYLPRIAFNLDRAFKKCSACGKQALCMCMGFGCNSVGVSGARIIDSERERLIAIITNSLVPCNGRFPTIVAIIAMFLSSVGLISYLIGSLIFALIIVGSVLITLLASHLLSKTFLRGSSSAFSIELPPYRVPDFRSVIVTSLLTRTASVLLRAVVVAAPAGLLIWIFASVSIGEVSILKACSDLLEPIASFLGLDGAILLAFILGIPANEIVIPIIIMIYTGGSSLVDFESYASLKTLLVANGWTAKTAICTLLFSVFHWPCSTTLITAYKETKSIKYTALAFITPVFFGVVLCSLCNLIFYII